MDFLAIIPVPVIQAQSKSFKDKLEISITTQNPHDKIYCDIVSLENNNESKSFFPYLNPITINQSHKIVAKAVNKNQESNPVSSTFFKKPNNYTINIKSTYNPQYHAGGPDGLLDGIFGTTNWRKGDWQGYQGQDFESVIDLQKNKTIHSVAVNCLQDSRSWILMPTKIEYYISLDNNNFTLAGFVENKIDPKETETKINSFELKLEKDVTIRYIKVKAFTFGKLPEWHQGFGGEAFIFLDEITIK